VAITVIGAAYGSKIAGMDVTQIVQARLDAGNYDVDVSNEAFGGIRTTARRSGSASFTGWTQGR
jgi:hypothetical protein